MYGRDGLLRATPGAVGVDLRSCAEREEPIPPGERRLIGTGIAIEPMAPGIAGFVYSRSGLGGLTGIVVAQGVGVIDPDYRGEIRVPLLNTGREVYMVHPGERIAQLVFQPFCRPVFREVARLGGTKRGSGGFGHTGRK
ncbi:MAG: dUTP diphosphatase [Desulfovibrio sp.]|nr:dUTP diphosphatase [Desulfovibrio sp.]